MDRAIDMSTDRAADRTIDREIDMSIYRNTGIAIDGPTKLLTDTHSATVITMNRAIDRAPDIV